METYVVLRRNGWNSVDELGAAVDRSRVESERTLDEIAWIRSYVLDERDGRIGTACVFEAAGPEAIRRHAVAAGLPIDEIVKVAGTVVVRPDAAVDATSGEERA